MPDEVAKSIFGITVLSLEYQIQASYNQKYLTNNNNGKCSGNDDVPIISLVKACRANSRLNRDTLNFNLLAPFGHSV